MKVLRRFNDLSIQKKTVLLIVSITGVALLLFTLLSVSNQVMALRKSRLHDLAIVTEGLAGLTSAGLNSADRKEADQILESFKVDPDIEIAVVYDSHDRPFTVYLNPRFSATASLPAVVEEKSQRFKFEYNRLKIELYTPVILSGKRLGTLYVLANTDRLVTSIKHSVLLLVFGMVMVLLVIAIVANRLQRLITGPVSDLTETARRITRSGDYSIRVKRATSDEIGQLIEDFNIMVRAVQVRDNRLNRQQRNLEQLVKERTEELRAKRDEALAAARAKSEFLANMSHEIRTPMNGVIGVLSLLQEAPFSEENRRLLATASRSADSLLLIINDILDFSKIDAGMISFETVPFELHSLVEESSRLFIDAASDKGIELSCCIEDGVPAMVKGDPTRLRQIITNLLSNGVKFTEKGDVRLRVSVEESVEAGVRLRFTVTDTGIGISANGLERIFEKFTQADGSTARKYGGTGLGLSVCKQLVERLGGVIEAKSNLGLGASFSFILAFTAVDGAGNPGGCPDLSGERFLVLGCSKLQKTILEYYLESCGGVVMACNDRAEFIEQLDNSNWPGDSAATLFIGYRLLKENGAELIDLIRSEIQQNIRIVLIYSGALSAEEIRLSGVDSTLLAPLSRGELYGCLRQNEEGVSPRAGSPAEPARSHQLSGKVLLVDDDPINRKVMEAILRRLGITADLAGNGYEAVRMAASVGYPLILMDVQMPGMSGLEATEQIREAEFRDGKARAFIVAITANALGATRQRCLEAGMDDFITKPIKPVALAERLRPWLDSEVVPESVPEQQVAAIDSPARAWNKKRALAHVGGEEQLLCDMASLFLDRYEQHLLAIEGAVAASDSDNLSAAAHSFKGTVSHFAAEEARKLAARLEAMGTAGELGDAMILAGRLRQETEKLCRELRGIIKEMPVGD